MNKDSRKFLAKTYITMEKYIINEGLKVFTFELNSR